MNSTAALSQQTPMHITYPKLGIMVTTGVGSVSAFDRGVPATSRVTGPARRSAEGQ